MCITLIRVSASALLQSMLCGMCSLGSNFPVRDASYAVCIRKNEHAQKRLTVIRVTAFALAFPKQRFRLTRSCLFNGIPFIYNYFSLDLHTLA